MAPLYYYYSNDTAAVNVQDEYMWGENILVAPVLEKGATERKYYLPKGTWLNPSTFSLTEGGKWYTSAVNIWDIPVFYKEGAFVTKIDFPKIDKEAKLSNTSKIDRSHLAIVYVESENKSSFELYDDDGTSKNSLQTKQYELLNFSSSGRNGNKLHLGISSTNGNYAGKPSTRELKILIFSKAKGKISQIFVNGKPVKEVFNADDLISNTYANPPMRLIAFEVVFNGKPIDIEVIW
jgi:oligosaccharide 4-alpha-D-glucosyltransferase